jgi:hypothetical protein
MKFLVTGSLALWGAMLVSGCGGGAGPPTPFNPFGTDPSGTVPEPAGSSGETPPSGGQTIGQLCANVCAQIEASCPSYASGSCDSHCNQAATQYPSCVGELKLFLSCAATAQITCNGQSVQVPSCMSSQISLESCQAGGTVTMSTGGAP